MKYEGIEPELEITRTGTRMWGFGEVLGASLLIAAIFLAVGSIAAGLLTAGTSPSQNQVAVDILYATQWVSPYIVLFPLAALAAVWWRLRAVGGNEVAPETGTGSPTFSRVVILAGGVLLVVVAAGAIGAMVSTLVLIHASDAPGNQVWPSGAETLSQASAALVLSITGLVWFGDLLGRVWNRAVPTEEDETEQVEDVMGLEESPVTAPA